MSKNNKERKVKGYALASPIYDSISRVFLFSDEAKEAAEQSLMYTKIIPCTIVYKRYKIPKKK